MDTPTILLGVSILIGIVGWFVTLERRLNTRLTFDEHQKICDRANARIEKSLDDLKESQQDFRLEVRDSLRTVATRIDNLAKS